MKTLYQGDLVVSAMFLTATAPNPLVAEFARQGSGIAVTWTTWALAACVPGIVGLVLVPYVIYRLCPPDDAGHQSRTVAGCGAPPKPWGHCRAAS